MSSAADRCSALVEPCGRQGDLGFNSFAAARLQAHQCRIRKAGHHQTVLPISVWLSVASVSAFLDRFGSFGSFQVTCTDHAKSHAPWHPRLELSGARLRMAVLEHARMTAGLQSHCPTLQPHQAQESRSSIEFASVARFAALSHTASL